MIAGKLAPQIFAVSLPRALRSCIVDGFAKIGKIQKIIDFWKRRNNEASNTFYEAKMGQAQFATTRKQAFLLHGTKSINVKTQQEVT